MYEKYALNRSWEFTEHFSEEFVTGGGEGVTVCLPHTVKETPYNYFDDAVYQMDACYRRRVSVPESWAGKRIFLNIGAAGHYARVYVDGRFAAEHRCGYTAFRTELTDLVTPGREALIAVETDSRESLDQPPFGYVIDYMTYGGLYREVWLEVKERSFISDVFVRPDVSGNVECTVTVDGPSEGLTVYQRVTRGGEILAECHWAAGEERPALTVDNPALWDLEDPALYTLVTELLRGGEVLDGTRTRFGFRSARFEADGFYLNGKKVKIVGLNRHQSYPYVGYAMPENVQRLDADILKYELGVNAVRTSHYPQSPHFIDRCDELGLLVFTEIPGWQHIGGEAWKDVAVRNVEEMVTQYRNHPSIVLWGVRINESADDDGLYMRTNEAAHRLDPTRQTGGVRNSKRGHFFEDVYTYNDFVHDGRAPGCEPKKAVVGDVTRPYLISEYNGHMFPTKTFDDEEHRLEHALRHANVLDAVAAREDICGSIGWCMFDYNTHKDFGSGDRICYHGVTDMFRNKKLAADVYGARQDRTPVLAVSSSMDVGEHPAGNRGRLFVMTNADEVRFYKNGEYIRTYTHKDSPYKHMYRPPIEIDDYLGDQIEKGEGFSPVRAKFVKDILNHSARFGSSGMPLGLMLKAGWLMLRYGMTFSDAYALYGKYIGNWGKEATVYRFDAVKDGKVVRSVERGPVASLHLRAEVDHTNLREEDTWDAALVRLAMTDQRGNVLPVYNGPVRLCVTGPIELIGPDTAVLRGGLGGTWVRTAGQAGPGTLTIKAENANPVTIAFTVAINKKEVEI